MDPVRPLVEDDLPQIAELYRKVFAGKNDGLRRRSPSSTAYLAEIFFRHPWAEKALPSLVYEDARGRMIGCLGVMPRRMSMRGRPVQAAVSHNFMVEPGSRSTLAGVALMRAFFSGPQDLSMAEGNSTSRKIWEGLGGATSLLHSLRWLRPLRPSRYLLSFVSEHGLPEPVGYALRPICRVMDSAAAGMAHQLFQFPSWPAADEELTAATFLTRVAEFSRDRSLRPEYDHRSIEWLFALLARKKGRGIFRKVVVRNGANALLGWYLYYLNPGGTSEVVQLVASRHTMPDVLGHLFSDAWRRGAAALSGQLDPPFMQAFVDTQCLCRGGTWMLIHSRDRDLLQAIQTGDALLTRLEGEWWIGMQGGWT